MKHKKVCCGENMELLILKHQVWGKMTGKGRKLENAKQMEQIPLKDLSNGTVKKMVVFFCAVLLSTLFVSRYSEEHGK
jgi:hypothetical protein